MGRRAIAGMCLASWVKLAAPVSQQAERGSGGANWAKSSWVVSRVELSGSIAAGVRGDLVSWRDDFGVWHPGADSFRRRSPGCDDAGAAADVSHRFGARICWPNVGVNRICPTYEQRH
jgi:hypothetical protein